MSDDLMAKAKAVISLWDLNLFSNGTKEARQKRAEVLHKAVTRMAAAVGG